MNSINLTPEQRQFITRMADLWVRQNGINSASQALVIATMMKQAEEPTKPNQKEK